MLPLIHLVDAAECIGAGTMVVPVTGGASGQAENGGLCHYHYIPGH